MIKMPHHHYKSKWLGYYIALVLSLALVSHTSITSSPPSFSCFAEASPSSQDDKAEKLRLAREMLNKQTKRQNDKEMKDIIKEQAVKMKEQTAANYQRQKEREERRKRMDERDKKKKREGAKRRKTEL